jgi:hypothetical protein
MRKSKIGCATKLYWSNLGRLYFSSTHNVMKLLPFILLLYMPQFSFSQKTDSTKKLTHFGAGISVTHNGIAFVPAFSLGKPAAIFDVSVGRRLSFDPQFRFSLKGEPWAFIFSWRYKLLTKNKLRIILGAHPSVNFRYVTNMDSSATTTVFVRRYWTMDLAPNYFITKNISVGAYYLYSRGIDKEAIKNTHLISLNTNFSNIRLSDQFFMRITPQAYYLRQIQYDGFYVTSTLALAKKNFPLTLSSILNKAIRSDIPGSKDFIWNLIVTYSFNKYFVEK